MCWEDIKIARSCRTKLFSSTASADVPGNPNRIAVRLQLTPTDISLTPQIFVTLGAVKGVEGGSNIAQQILAAVHFQVLAGGVDPVAVAIAQLDATVRLADVGDILRGGLRITQTGTGRWWFWESSLETQGPPTKDYGNI